MMLVTPTLAFGFSTPDIVLILVVALLLFGPKNMPKMARTIGKSMEEFRRAAREIESEIMKEPEPTTPPPPPPPPTEATPGDAAAPTEPMLEGTPHATDESTAAISTPAVVVADAPVAALSAPPLATAPVSSDHQPEAVPPVPAVAPPVDATTQPTPVNPPVEKTPDVKTAP